MEGVLKKPLTRKQISEGTAAVDLDWNSADGIPAYLLIWTPTQRHAAFGQQLGIATPVACTRCRKSQF
ncbi:hypothetical protein N7510_009732 [Penicillium lagena]|uniref:uncharacterized protein n=1 Tax=Penicillium lagena TaxID=94218 RepID=UPI0025405BE6|nr:uncharacterized protein N7510_009732 [Penicillium lagena]KAJ5604578.1 hypothetical protein N7510_009732 [Penicillium lagena]